MKHSKHEIRNAIDCELIAFKLTKNLSFKELYALSRRINLIVNALTKGSPLPKPSKRYINEMQAAAELVNFMPKLRVVK